MSSILPAFFTVGGIAVELPVARHPTGIAALMRNYRTGDKSLSSFIPEAIFMALLYFAEL
jgi:hypothetical protein